MYGIAISRRNHYTRAIFLRETHVPRVPYCTFYLPPWTYLHCTWRLKASAATRSRGATLSSGGRPKWQSLPTALKDAVVGALVTNELEMRCEASVVEHVVLRTRRSRRVSKERTHGRVAACGGEVSAASSHKGTAAKPWRGGRVRERGVLKCDRTVLPQTGKTFPFSMKWWPSRLQASSFPGMVPL